MIVSINKIGILSMAKIFGVLQLFVGLVTGVFFTLAYVIDPRFIETTVGGAAAVFGFWSFIILPILNGALGFVSGALIGFVYNLSAKFLGKGMQIDIESMS